MSAVWDVSKSNKTIGSRWKILPRTKECGGLSRRPESYFWELYWYYKSAILSVCIYFLLIHFPWNWFVNFYVHEKLLLKRVIFIFFSILRKRRGNVKNRSREVSRPDISYSDISSKRYEWSFCCMLFMDCKVKRFSRYQ